MLYLKIEGSGQGFTCACLLKTYSKRITGRKLKTRYS